MIDDYSLHVDSLSLSSISDIANASSEEGELKEKYHDSAKVCIAGIITAKRTKTLKNGDVMAFVTVEDRIGEIDVIVFAKQYASISGELNEENAVIINGRVSEEEGEPNKIILSSIKPLLSNAAFKKEQELKNSSSANTRTDESKLRVFIKIDTLSEEKVTPIYRLANLNPGRASIVIYDASAQKYVSMKNLTISAKDEVIDGLMRVYGNGNVVIK